MRVKIRRGFALFVIAAFCMTLLVATGMACATDESVVYDEKTDYMAEMQAAAAEGTPDALLRGALYERCRNQKIRDLNLEYDETGFFEDLEKDPAEIAEEIRVYVFRYTWTYVGRFYITGYDICVTCCGKTDGITKSGTKGVVGRTCGAPRKYPFGTVFYIDGIGERVVEDRGRLGNDYHIDVLCNNHAECYAITEYYDVWRRNY